MVINEDNIKELDKTYRLNLINSITGVKPANLIGTQSADGIANVAIFSSIIHLGSNPALLGFVMRPLSDPPRDTYTFIQETGYYTINHISESFMKQAHYTSAKLARGESEFDKMKLSKEYIDDFHAPFVSESFVKVGMKFHEGIPLPNGCTLVIGSVELIIAPDDALNAIGQLDLSNYDNVGISGLNTYYKLSKLTSFPYVRSNEIPQF